MCCNCMTKDGIRFSAVCHAAMVHTRRKLQWCVIWWSCIVRNAKRSSNTLHIGQSNHTTFSLQVVPEINHPVTTRSAWMSSKALLVKGPPISSHPDLGQAARAIYQPQWALDPAYRACPSAQRVICPAQNAKAALCTGVVGSRRPKLLL